MTISCGIAMPLFQTAHFCSVQLLSPFPTWDKCTLLPLSVDTAPSPGSHFLESTSWLCLVCFPAYFFYVRTMVSFSVKMQRKCYLWHQTLKREVSFCGKKLPGLEDEIPNAVKEREAAGHEMMKETQCPAERGREGMKRRQWRKRLGNTHDTLPMDIKDCCSILERQKGILEYVNLYQEPIQT